MADKLPYTDHDGGPWNFPCAGMLIDYSGPGNLTKIVVGYSAAFTGTIAGSPSFCSETDSNTFTGSYTLTRVPYDRTKAPGPGEFYMTMFCCAPPDGPVPPCPPTYPFAGGGDPGTSGFLTESVTFALPPDPDPGLTCPANTETESVQAGPGFILQPQMVDDGTGTGTFICTGDFELSVSGLLVMPSGFDPVAFPLEELLGEHSFSKSDDGSVPSETWSGSVGITFS